MITVYHESFEAEKFLRFSQFFPCLQNLFAFLYENLRWRYSDMDLRVSMWESAEVFHKGLCLKFATKLFCLKTSMVYSRFWL